MVPHPVDVYVGKRLRARRTLLGMSQEHLGEAVGITFQQIQKYERGLNRIGSSRLYEFSRILSVPISFFFEDLYENDDASNVTSDADGGKGDILNRLTNKEVLSLVRSYYAIPDDVVRKRVLQLIKALSVELPQEESDSSSEESDLLSV